MTLLAFEGAAGCGKTVSLMETLEDTLATDPLNEGQRVLALTFMHGARRRLHDKLSRISNLRRRTECMTVDSFAQHLVRRWRGLAIAVGVPPLRFDQFDAQCDAAGLLIEQAEVAAWVAASFPVVLVDEAQDLKPERLRMISALSSVTTLIVAADDFQCLVQSLRPNPCVAWIRSACEPVVLKQARRTSVPALLAAAVSIREGNAPISDKQFKIFAAKGIPMAAVYLANAIAWRGSGNVAVITPSLSGSFARDVVSRVVNHACGRRQNGPYAIQWERSEEDEAHALSLSLVLGETASLDETIRALRTLPATEPVRETISWVQRQARAADTKTFARIDVAAVLVRKIALRRQRLGADHVQFSAMTVQQAKNREFDGVVVLWPYKVGGDSEHKRRLLYNAVTRARRWCTVILQSEDLLKLAPFS